MDFTIKEVNPKWLSLIPADFLVVQKLMQSGFMVFLIPESGRIISPDIEPRLLPDELREIALAWNKLHSLFGNNQRELIRLTHLIESLSSCDLEIDSPFNKRVRHLIADETGSIYFSLLDNGNKFPVYSFFRKIHFQKIRQGYYPIHASGIVYKGSLLVFGGPSGIGKSTISGLSAQHGAKVLDEDQLLLKKIAEVYSADAWGYSLIESSIPIKAVIKLHQSQEDSLVRLNRAQTGRFLITQMIDAVGNDLPKEILFSIVTRSAEIARSIPGYQLNFRNSPDFWHLLEAEFFLE